MAHLKFQGFCDLLVISEGKIVVIDKSDFIMKVNTQVNG